MRKHFFRNKNDFFAQHINRFYTQYKFTLNYEHGLFILSSVRSRFPFTRLLLFYTKVIKIWTCAVCTQNKSHFTHSQWNDVCSMKSPNELIADSWQVRFIHHYFTAHWMFGGKVLVLLNLILSTLFMDYLREPKLCRLFYS